MNTDIHYSNWTEQDRVAIAQAITFNRLADIAVGIIDRTSGCLNMVSGAISSGPGNIEDKLNLFRATIEYKADVENLAMFSQIPFEDKMRELVEIWRIQSGNNGYCWPLLYEFYQRVFFTKRIVKMHFMPGWNVSIGAKWEREACRNLGIAILDIPEEVMSAVRARMNI
jgi:hypothetical protein